MRKVILTGEEYREDLWKNEYSAEFDLALEAAVKVGAFLKGSGHAIVDSAVGRDIKLSADRRSEEIIFDILSKSGIPILSEESGYIGNGKDEKIWLIDPLDGTANYWKGMKELACVSISLWENEMPVLGIINRFHLQEIFSGIVGEGAWLNGQSITTSDVSHIRDAVLATGFPVQRDYGEKSLSIFIKKVQNFKKIRMLGAAAIMGAFVADGRIDVYMEDEIMLWDIAAASAIVRAAGGSMELTLLKDYKCNCKLFASEALLKEYHDMI